MFVRFVDFKSAPPLVGFLIQSKVGMFSGLEKCSEPSAFDRHRGIQPGGLRFIRLDDRRDEREVPGLSGLRPSLGTTEAAYVRRVGAPVNNHLAGFRA